MSTETKAPVLPSNIKALYQRIIDAVGVERTNWNDAAKEIGVKDANGAPVGENTELKKERSTQFADLMVAKYNPELVGKDSDVAKNAYKQARTHFASCMNRALVRLGYRQATERSASSKVTKATSTQPATEAPTSAPNVLDARFGTIAGMIQELTVRAADVQAGLVAFQVSHKLTKAATEAFGGIADKASGLAQAIAKLSEFVVSGTTPEQAAADLAAAMPKPAPSEEPAQEPATA